jgi:integrative and conjugative element protein (TIGR02256 family)
LEKFLQRLITFRTEGAAAVTVSVSVLEKIKALSTKSAEIETGGIVVGYNVGRDIQVTDVSDPGPNAKRSATHFLRDTEHCRNFLARSYDETGADYVGEWHSHVIGLRRLSRGDIGTLVRILIDPDYDFASFAVMLALVENDKSQLIVYVAERGRHVYPQLETIKIVELYRGEFPLTDEELAEPRS